MPRDERFLEVDLGQVQRPALDPHWQVNQHGRTRAEMEVWTQGLADLQSQFREGASAEDVRRLATSDNTEERALHSTYRAYYEPAHGGAIRMGWNDEAGRLQVDNGQHRVWLAQEQGLRHLPAYVSADDPQTLERLRESGERAAGPERPHQPTETRTESGPERSTPTRERG